MSLCLCLLMFLMKSLKVGEDGWHSIIPCQDRKACLLLSLGTSSRSMFYSGLSSLYLALCVLLTDLFFLKILSLPPPNCRIYFSFSAEQILHFYLFRLFPSQPIPLSSSIFPSTLYFLKSLSVRQLFFPGRQWLNYFGLNCNKKEFNAQWSFTWQVLDRGGSNKGDLMGLSPARVMMCLIFSGRVINLVALLFFLTEYKQGGIFGLCGINNFLNCRHNNRPHLVFSKCDGWGHLLINQISWKALKFCLELGETAVR